jgi:hypothetical protein
MELTVWKNYILIFAQTGFVIAWLCFFLRWVFIKKCGTSELKSSPVRRNKMAVYTPFIPLFIWVFAMLAADSLVKRFFTDLQQARRAAADNLILSVSAITAAAVIVYIVKKDFVRGFKGFGLGAGTIVKDLWDAFVTLLAVWLPVITVIALTQLAGKFIFGESFEIPKHRELEVIVKHASLQLRLLVFITAVVVIPVFEEMLFRGMFETMIRAYTGRVWVSIILCSVIFATAHPDASHWFGLFVLSLGLGYVYEKTGSLWSAIFMHSMFNGIAIISTIYIAAG